MRLRAVLFSWYVSWPLPAMSTVSPGFGERDGQRDGRLAVGFDQVALLARARLRRAHAPQPALLEARRHFTDDAVRVFSARVVRSDDRQIGLRSPAASPISGRLPVSRSPPQPKTHDQLALGDVAGRVDGAGERVVGVRVVE